MVPDCIYQLDLFHRNKAVRTGLNEPRLQKTVLELLYRGKTQKALDVIEASISSTDDPMEQEKRRKLIPVPFPVSWTVKMKKKQKETQDILSYHSQAAGCSDKARAKASGGRQPIEECGRTGL